MHSSSPARASRARHASFALALSLSTATLGACARHVSFFDDASARDASIDAAAHRADSAAHAADSSTHARDATPRDARPSNPDVIEWPEASSIEYSCADLADPARVDTVCDGTIEVRRPAPTHEGLVNRPWDGAPRGGTELASRVCALVVTPEKNLTWAHEHQLQLHAYARVSDGRWHDVTAVVAWSITSNSHDRDYTIDDTGRATWRPSPGSPGGYLFDGSTNIVAARFGAHVATQRWRDDGFEPSFPVVVRGPSVVRRCTPTQLAVTTYAAGFTHEHSRGVDAETVLFTVSDPSVLAVDERGMLTGLRPGTATVAGVSSFQLCDAAGCEYRRATGIEVTVVDVPPSDDASIAADATTEVGP